MSVKTIFKALIGTVVLIVVGFLTVELFNITTTTFLLNSISKVACEQSAQLFVQETYKETVSGGTTSGTTRFGSIQGPDGQQYVSGDFYSTTSKDIADIYNSLYKDSADYTEWTSRGNYASETGTEVAWADSTESQANTWPAMRGMISSSITGKSLRENLVTPANLGIPYLDPTFLNKAFKWNIAMLFGKCSEIATGSFQTTAVQNDPVKHIAFNGYMVYADKAKITDLEYKVFKNLNTDITSANAFKSLTGINPEKLTKTGTGEGAGVGDHALLNDAVYRNNICVVTIKYSIPIGYRGITPISNVISAINTSVADGGLSGVQGKSDQAAATSGQQFNTLLTKDLKGECLYYIVS